MIEQFEPEKHLNQHPPTTWCYDGPKPWGYAQAI